MGTPQLWEEINRRKSKRERGKGCYHSAHMSMWRRCNVMRDISMIVTLRKPVKV